MVARTLFEEALTETALRVARQESWLSRTQLEVELHVRALAYPDLDRVVQLRQRVLSRGAAESRLGAAGMRMCLEKGGKENKKRPMRRFNFKCNRSSRRMSTSSVRRYVL